MKKIKLFLGVALLGAMSFGAFTAYDYYTMSEEERFLLANIEALTNDEGGTSTSWDCWSKESSGSAGYWRSGNPCVFVKGAIGKGGTGTCYK